MTRPSLSVVIPAYNESAVIEDCLRPLLVQADDILEIIVVDNNSRDDTAAKVRRIASEYSAATGRQLVTLLHEPRQGLPYARNTGLDAATGDVIARIDADARVEPGWALGTAEFFERYGQRYGAGSGACTAYDLPFQGKFRTSQETLSRNMEAKLEAGDDADAPRLFGSNMAISRVVWQQIRNDVSTRTDIFEDVDLTICATDRGIRCAFIPNSRATISGRRFKTGLVSYLRYCWCDQRTFAIHGRSRDRLKSVATMCAVTLPFYFVMWVPFRAWDPSAQKFDIRQLIGSITGAWFVSTLRNRLGNRSSSDSTRSRDVFEGVPR